MQTERPFNLKQKTLLGEISRNFPKSIKLHNKIPNNLIKQKRNTRLIKDLGTVVWQKLKLKSAAEAVKKSLKKKNGRTRCCPHFWLQYPVFLHHDQLKIPVSCLRSNHYNAHQSSVNYGKQKHWPSSSSQLLNSHISQPFANC